MNEKNHYEHPSRRQFLSGIGAGAAGIASLPAVAAAPSEEEQTARQAGILPALRRLSDQGKFEQAHRLCRVHNVPDSLSQAQMPSFDVGSGSSGGSGDFQTQDAFKNSDSRISLYSYWQRVDPEGQDIYSVRVFADIAEDDANLIDDANPRDGIALFWSDTYFQPVSVSQSNYVELGNSKEHQYFSQYRNYGVWAKFDDNAIQDSSIALDGRVRRYTCGIRTEVEKLRSGNTFNINAQYLHNWNLGGIYHVSGFSLGPVGLSFGGTNVSKWIKARTIKV